MLLWHTEVHVYRPHDVAVTSRATYDRMWDELGMLRLVLLSLSTFIFPYFLHTPLFFKGYRYIFFIFLIGTVLW